MKLEWTSKALGDLARLYEFLAPHNPNAAAQLVQNLARAPELLPANPRIGEKLEAFIPREVRRLIVGQYEIRYEIQAGQIYVLRVWHSREQR